MIPAFLSTSVMIFAVLLLTEPHSKAQQTIESFLGKSKFDSQKLFDGERNPPRTDHGRTRFDSRTSHPCGDRNRS